MRCPSLTLRLFVFVGFVAGSFTNDPSRALAEESPTAIFVEDQFRLPGGFRIYRVASAELCGGSYDITFDGEGRLLVGDGTKVRRLTDRNRDGLFDHREVIAEGLGSRGPQGLLVYGDRVYAVGGDGIQVFRGYRSEEVGDDGVALPRWEGELEHVGRLGEPFHTGGDHAAHTVFRGHDDYLYFITGDGGGARDRVHITEETSPSRRERACSVFRISAAGDRWECIGTGGRNAPNLGMNYAGDLFSLDSDMEWHVALPWWRPVRLHHWVTGGDQGWQGVGAYPPYYVDNLPGILDVGRGSPDWGQFYEHDHFPDRYRDAYFVADYRSKSATSGGYNSSGRLFAFFLTRHGATWRAEQEVFARPIDGAKTPEGQPIDFALVDIEVGPDGSVYASDHRQGVWRIVYDPEHRYSAASLPPILPREPAEQKPADADRAAALARVLALPQPMAEWSRLRRARLAAALGEDYLAGLIEIALRSSEPLRSRLQAIRYLAPEFGRLDADFVRQLAEDPEVEVRGQAAWLGGIRRQPDETAWLVPLSADASPFVRRRALEALMRHRLSREELNTILPRLEESERVVRYTAMQLLAHYPTEDWFDAAVAEGGPQRRIRALIAAHSRTELPPVEQLRALVNEVITAVPRGASKENRLDALRLIGRLREAVGSDLELRSPLEEFVLGTYPNGDRDIRFEETRLIGEMRCNKAFEPLVSRLESATDPIEQFHVAQALARLPSGWDEGSEARAVDWFLASQSGWFSVHDGKGLQFRQFWATVLADFVRKHRPALVDSLDRVELTSQLGALVLDSLAEAKDSVHQLSWLYASRESVNDRRRIVERLSRVKLPEASSFLRDAMRRAKDPELQKSLYVALSEQPVFSDNRPYLEQGLFHDDVDVFRASALALCRYRADPTEDIVSVTLSRMLDRRDLFRAGERLLVALCDVQRDGYRESADVRRSPEDKDRETGATFWKGWYLNQFGAEFESVTGESTVSRSNAELRRFLLSDEAAGGVSERGRTVYDNLCSRCHGNSSGRSKETVIFGPDLAGVTRRLSAEELVDSLVNPSLVVAERFKGVNIQVRGGVLLSGFVTESSDDSVTLVAKDRVHEIPRKKILFMTPQETSLMPEGALNRLEDRDLRDLMAYLGDIGSKETPAEADPPSDDENESGDEEAPKGDGGDPPPEPKRPSEPEPDNPECDEPAQPAEADAEPDP